MKIKNLLFQPLTLHLGVDGTGLHLGAREARDIAASRVSEEIRRAEERGLVSLIEALTPKRAATLKPSETPETDTKKGSSK